MPASYCRREHLEVLDAAAHITCADDALGVIHLTRKRPAEPEIIVLVLDERHGHTVLVVGGTDHADTFVDVVEFAATSLAAAGRPGELVAATIRPDVGPLPGDADRWMEASIIAGDHGCELIEWFVITGDVAWCPRDLLGEPPRW